MPRFLYFLLFLILLFKSESQTICEAEVLDAKNKLPKAEEHAVCYGKFTHITWVYSKDKIGFLAGKKFISIPFNQPESVKTEIQFLYEARDSCLYIISRNKLFRFNPKKGSTQLVVKKKNNISALFLPESDSAIITTEKNEKTHIIHLQSGKGREFFYAEKDYSFSGFHVKNSIVEIGLANNRKFPSNIVRVVHIPYNYSKGDRFNFLVCNKDEVVFCKSGNDSIYRYETGTGLLSFKCLLPKQLAEQEIRNVIELQPNLHLLTLRSGLYTFNSQTALFAPVFLKDAHTKNAINNITSHVYETEEQTIWVAPFFGGLYAISKNNFLFHTPLRFSNFNHIPFQLNVHDSLVYLSRQHLGIEILSKNYEVKDTIKPRFSSTPDWEIFAILHKGSYSICLSSIQNQVQILNRETKKIVKQLSIPNNNRIRTGADIPVGLTTGTGILIGIANEVFSIDTNLSGISRLPVKLNESISHIEPCENNDFYVSTLSGIFKCNRTKGISDTLFLKPKAGIRYFCRLSSGQLAAAGDKGFFLVQSKRLPKYLINEFVYGILEDGFGHLWLPSDNGIIRYSLKNKKLTRYTTFDGIQGKEFNQFSFCKVSPFEFACSGMNGLTFFNPESFKSNSETGTRLFISSISVNDQLIKRDSLGVFAEGLYLKPRQRTISLIISPLQYKFEEDSFFYYKLNGYEDQWVKTNYQNNIRYANLPYGDYVLEIKSDAGSGYSQKLPVHIATPWYLSGFAKTIYVLSSVLFVAFIFYTFKRATEKKQKQHIETLQLLQKERDRISRDLHDHLGSMVSFLNIKTRIVENTSPDKEEIAEYLLHVKHTSANIMAGLREAIWTLNEHEISNFDLADKLKVYFRNNLVIPFTVSDQIEAEKKFKGAIVLNTFRSCQEIISNINKHSAANKVNIVFYSTDHYSFILEIADNGKGLSEAEINRPDAYGLRNIRSRINEAGGVFEFGNSETGTRFIIKLS